MTTKTNRSYLTLLLLALKPTKPSGYTLLESLMAIVVVAILVAAVAPMLALTTASRVQARRVDQATQALRAYIDGVRGGALPPPQKFVVVDPDFAFKPPFYDYPPATSLSGYVTASDRDPGTLVDTNGNGFNINDPQDLVIQAIRPIATATPRLLIADKNTPAELDLARKQGYIMVLRVYRADAFSGGNTPDLTEQPNVLIGGVGSRRNPLVSTFAEVFQEGTLTNIRVRNNKALGTLSVPSP